MRDLLVLQVHLAQPVRPVPRGSPGRKGSLARRLLAASGLFKVSAARTAAWPNAKTTKL